MRRIALLLLLAWLGFFVGWPAWCGYRIKTAIENEEPSVLEDRIDFPAVRASMKPVMTAEVERTIARALKDAGPLGALLGNQVRGDLAGQLVASAIDSIVTPVNIIKIAHDRKSIREATEQATAEQIGGGLGGMLGGDIGGRGGVLEKSGKPRQGQGGDQSRDQPKPAETESKPAAAPPGGQAGTPGKRRFGLSNIKRISVTGPLSFAVGIVRDPRMTEPEVTAEMRFINFDWKVVSIIPRLDADPQ